MADFKVITGLDLKKLSRFSYAHVWEPRKDPKKEPSEWKYEISILIPKSAKADIKKINEAIAAARQDGIDRNVYKGKIIEKNFRNALGDGDSEEREDDEPYHNHWYLSARSKVKPGIVDHNADPILDKTEFYSGCFGRASVSFYPYEVDGAKGVGVSLNNIQKIKDGEALGGSKMSAESEFESYKVDAADIDDDDMFD